MYKLTGASCLNCLQYVWKIIRKGNIDIVDGINENSDLYKVAIHTEKQLLFILIIFSKNSHVLNASSTITHVTNIAPSADVAFFVKSKTLRLDQHLLIPSFFALVIWFVYVDVISFKSNFLICIIRSFWPPLWQLRWVVTFNSKWRCIFKEKLDVNVGFLSHNYWLMNNNRPETPL